MGGIGFLIPGLLAFVAIASLVAVDELFQIIQPEWFAFEGVVDVGAVVVILDVLGGGIFTGGAVVEEEHVGLHSLGVEDTGGQSEDGV